MSSLSSMAHAKMLVSHVSFSVESEGGMSARGHKGQRSAICFRKKQSDEVVALPLGLEGNLGAL